MAIIKEVKLALADCEENHNKYWRGALTDSKEVILEWGRIGDALQQKTKTFDNQYQAENFLESKIAEKNNLIITGGSDFHGSRTEYSNSIGSFSNKSSEALAAAQASGFAI